MVMHQNIGFFSGYSTLGFGNSNVTLLKVILHLWKYIYFYRTQFFRFRAVQHRYTLGRKLL